MRRSRRWPRLLRALGRTLATTSVVGLGCATEPPIVARAYEPGQVTSAHDGLRIDILEAIYDERQLTISVAFVNEGSEPATVERGGILLAHEELEFPLTATSTSSVPAQLELSAGGQQTVTLTFETGTRVVDGAQLRIRTVRRGDAWQELVSLNIPPAPTVAPR